MTLKANGVTWLRRTVLLQQESQGPDGTCPAAPPPPLPVARGDRALCKELT